MKVTIHQPTYWPWLGLLDKISKSELFVILDSVNVSKGSFQYRNKFLCQNNSKFITLPVNVKSNTKFIDLTFKNDNWRNHQLEFIRNYYNKSRYYETIFPLVKSAYVDFSGKSANDFIIHTMKKSLEWFGIKVKIIQSSELNIIASKGELVHKICNSLNASTYISGIGAKEYMTDSDYLNFKKSKINIDWQSFKHPVYNQSNNTNEFIDGLSCLDMLFHEGLNKCSKVFIDKNI